MSRSQRGAAVLNVLLSFAAFATVAYGIYEIIPTNAASQTAAAVLTESTTEGATASSKIGLQGPKQCDAPLEEKDQAPTDTVSTESKPEDEGLKKECVPGCLYRVQASGDVIATDLCALSTKEASA